MLLYVYRLNTIECHNYLCQLFCLYHTPFYIFDFTNFHVAIGQSFDGQSAKLWIIHRAQYTNSFLARKKNPRFTKEQISHLLQTFRSAMAGDPMPSLRELEMYCKTTKVRPVSQASTVYFKLRDMRNRRVKAKPQTRSKPHQR